MSDFGMRHCVEYVDLSRYVHYMLLNSGCSANRVTHGGTCATIQGNRERDGSLDRKDQIPDFIFE